MFLLKTLGKVGSKLPPNRDFESTPELGERKVNYCIIMKYQTLFDYVMPAIMIKTQVLYRTAVHARKQTTTSKQCLLANVDAHTCVRCHRHACLPGFSYFI